MLRWGHWPGGTRPRQEGQQHRTHRAGTHCKAALGQHTQLKRAHSRVLSFGGQLGKRDTAVNILPGQQVGGKSPVWAEICHWGRFLPIDWTSISRLKQALHGIQQQSTWTSPGKALCFHSPDGVAVKWDWFLHNTSRKRRGIKANGMLQMHKVL